jgi:MoaA/NifB/PqqE/SkfB family radical SAM enzyme
MTFEEIKPIIDSLKRNGHQLTQFHPYRMGEPLLCKDLERITKYVQDNLGIWTYLFTNGSLLTEERIRSLLSVPIAQIAISVDGAGPDYEKLRKNLKWKTLVRNVNNLCKIRDEMGSKTLVIIRYSFLPETPGVENQLRAAFPIVYGIVGDKFDHWGEDRIPKLPCEFLSSHFTVDANLNLLMCCKFSTHSLGKINGDMDIMKFWQERTEPLRIETDYKRMPHDCLICNKDKD